MKKIFLIMILILIFGINKIYALDIQRGYWSTDTSGWTNNQGRYVKNYQGSGIHIESLALNDTISNMNTYDYVVFEVNIYNGESGATYVTTASIDFATTCTNTESQYESYRITYADGSTANITPTQWGSICDGWDINGSITYNNQYFNIDLAPSINMAIVDSQNYRYWCENNNGVFKCPIASNRTYNNLYIVSSSSGAISNYGISIARNNYYFKDPSNAIIQSNNNNATNTQNKIDDVKNEIKNDNIDTNSTNSNTSSWSNMNASNGTITNLLTLPIQLMQGYVNGMNSSCTPFNLGTLFGTQITLPCINVGTLIGSTLWGIIDILFSGFMIFAIAKKLIKVFNDFTNMKSNQVDELYGGGA